MGGTPVLLLRQEVVPDAPFTATIDMPAPQAVEIPLRNPIGILPGATRPEEFVLVSAHYDHLGIGTPVNGDSIYNGADDDGSGTVGVMAIAEAYARAAERGNRPRRSVIFAIWDAEERGLLGAWLGDGSRASR